MKACTYKKRTCQSGRNIPRSLKAYTNNKERTTMQKKIKLTGRTPVLIDPDQWPVIARAKGEEGAYGPGCTPRPAGEYSTWTIVARQHADGRSLVYVVTDDSGDVWGRPLPDGCHDGGALLPAGADLAVAIQKVGRDCCVPAETVRRAIASLKPEVLR